MTTYFKAVRPNGTDFRTREIDYLAGGVISHPEPGRRGSDDAAGYLSVSTVATDCTGFSWPARLLEVEPVGAVWTPDKASMPNKRAVKALRVVRELDAPLLLGPQGTELVALFARMQTLTRDELLKLHSAWNVDWDAAWYVTEDTARGAAWGAARGAAWYAIEDIVRGAAWDAAWYVTEDTARGAARGLVVRDLIVQYGFTQGHYDVLTGPWRGVIGPIHADDAEVNG